MKAIVQTGYGTADVLKLKDIDKPQIGDDQVLVRVHAAALNPGDLFMMTGHPFLARSATGLLKPRGNSVVGWDVAGCVEAVGGNVTRLKPGDEVYGACDRKSGGSLAEYACAQAERLAPKPANLTFEEAAAVPVAGVTALRILRDAAHVRPGQAVLVNGASGGVGTFAVQIGKILGAEVTGVCSTRNVDMVRSLGADHVIDYTQDDFTKGGRRYDLILDNVGSHPFAEYRRALTPDGVILPNTGHAGMGYVLKAFALAPFMRSQGKMVNAEVEHRILSDLAELIESGQVTPVVERTYPLSDAPEAMRHLGGRHVRGKVVITV